MAKNTRSYYIEINGIKQSIDEIDVLMGKLDALDKRLQDLGKQTVNINVNTGATSSPTTSSSTPKASSASSEEEKMQRQILANEEKISAARTESYQKILDQKNELKNVQKEQKAINAETRLQDEQYANTLNGMRQKLADMKAALANVDLGDTDKMEKMIRATDELNTKIKEVEQSYGVYGRNVGNYANGVAEGLEKATNSANKINITVGGVVRTFDNARQASKTLGGELKKMAINGEQGTQAYKDLHKALSVLVSDINDATKSSVAMDNMLDTMTSIAAIGNIGEGFSNLFGIDDTALGETIAKMQSLQSILQGLEALNQQMLSGEGFGGWFAKGNEAIDNFVNKLFGLQNTIENTSNAGDAIKDMADGIADSAKDAAEGETTLATANAKTATSSRAASTASKTQATANTTLGTSTKAATTATEAQAVANTTLGGTSKATAASLEAQSAANVVMATTSKAATVAATAFSVALKTIGIGLIIGAVSLLIDGLKKLGDWLNSSSKKAKENADFMKDSNEAYLRAKVAIDSDIQSIKNFNGTKEQEKKKVEELNQKYGDSLGTYQSLKEWKDRLISVGPAYAENLRLEALMQAHLKRYIDLTNKALEAQYQLKHGGKWHNYWNDEAKNAAEAKAAAEEEMNAMKSIGKQQQDLQKKYGIGTYNNTNHKATQDRIAQTRKDGQDLKEQTERIEEEIVASRIRTMEDGFNKTMAQLENERNKRIAEAKKSGVMVKEQIKAINDEINAEVRRAQNKRIEDLKKSYEEYAKIFREENEKLQQDDINTLNEKREYLNTPSYRTEEFGKIREDSVKKYGFFKTFSEIDENFEKLYKKAYDDELKQIQEIYKKEEELAKTHYQNMYNEILDWYNKQTKALDKRKESGDLTEKEYKDLIDQATAIREKRLLEAQKEYYIKSEEERKKANENGLSIDEEYSTKELQLLNKKNNDLFDASKKYFDRLYQMRSSSLDKIDSLKEQSVFTDTKLVEQRSKSGYNASFMRQGFGIVDVKQTKINLENAQDYYAKFIKKLEDDRKELDIAFSKGIISKEVFIDEAKSMNTLSDNARKSMTEVGQALKDIPATFIQSIQMYVDAVGQSIQDILSSYSDLQNNRIEQEQEALEKEADMLDKELQKQQDIVEKHKTNINDIEEELKTARGDRREHLIDQINAEIQAQREAAAEEKRIEKEKEVNEKKQQKLAKKQQKQQQKNQIIQATISGGLAVVNALATKPFLPVGVAMAALAAATTAAQIAMMSKQKFANGGLLQGRSHSQGGIPVGNTGIEVEGNEFITNKKTTMQNLDLLDFINTKKRRLSLNDFVEFYNADGKKRIRENINASTKYANGGTLPSMQIPDISEQLQNIVAVQDTRPVVVAVTDIINKQNDVRRVQALAGLPNT